MAPVVVTPEDWGPFLWHMMYVVAIGMPAGDQGPSKEEQRGFRRLVDGLGATLPCSVCRTHFVNHIKQNPVDDSVTDTRDHMVSWVLGSHNAVRERQGKAPMHSGDIQRMIVDNHAKNKPQTADLALRYGAPLVLGLVLGAGAVWWYKAY